MNKGIISSKHRSPEFEHVITLGVSKKSSKSEINDFNFNVDEKGFHLAPVASNISNLRELFKLEFYMVNSLDDQAKLNLLDFILQQIPALFNQFIEHGFGLEGIERICLVDELLLNDIVSQIQREKGLNTDNTGQLRDDYVPAKTILYLAENGQFKGSIVLNLNIFVEMIEAFWQGKCYEEWTTRQQLAYYVLAHECSYAMDNFERNNIPTLIEMLDLKNNSEKWSEYYASLLFNEYLISVNVSDCVTFDLQSYFIENWNREIERFINQLLHRRKASDFHFIEVVNCFWRLLIGLGKLIGHETIKECFPAINFKNEENNEEIERSQQFIINELNITLNSFLRCYPEIPNKELIANKLTPFFERFAATYNFFFNDKEFLPLIED